MSSSIFIRLPDYLHSAIVEQAKSEDSDKSKVVRRILEEHYRTQASPIFAEIDAEAEAQGVHRNVIIMVAWAIYKQVFGFLDLKKEHDRDFKAELLEAA